MWSWCFEQVTAAQTIGCISEVISEAHSLSGENILRATHDMNQAHA
jgi:hypothetical protein